MVQFTINSFSNCLTGRPYNSIKDAIQDGVRLVQRKDQKSIQFRERHGKGL